MSPEADGTDFTAQDWGERYRTDNTPWDVGSAHPALAAELEKDLLGRRRFGHDARAFVPGCGNGHDALALAKAGWVVTAMDLVRELRDTLHPQLELHRSRFMAGDVLEYRSQPPFELLFEHTCFCAIPRERRADYGKMARRLVGYRGRLVAVVFPVNKPLEAGGPPHQTTVADLTEALGEGFKLIRHETDAPSLARREWKEEWAVFERLDVDFAEDQ